MSKSLRSSPAGAPRRSLAVLTAFMLALAMPVHAQPVLGSDAAQCQPGAGGSAALVTVTGFKDRAGRLRVQDYRGGKDEYLASGRYLRRQELPMTPGGEMVLCLALPGPGRYAIVALHDRNEDGRLSVWGDGIGFSNNPRLALAKPPAERTLVDFGPGVTPVRIVLNYRRGLLSVAPLEPKDWR